MDFSNTLELTNLSAISSITDIKYSSACIVKLILNQKAAIELSCFQGKPRNTEPEISAVIAAVDGASEYSARYFSGHLGSLPIFATSLPCKCF